MTGLVRTAQGVAWWFRGRKDPRIMALLGATAGLFLLAWASPAPGAGSGSADVLEADFRLFLDVYVRKVKEEDADFLAAVHPDLPKELYGFFFDATQGMMRHAERNGLSPTVTCREYGVCKTTWPQPNDSWAAQTFIRHEGRWRWLAE